jgi:hypothetical protein
VEVTRRRRALHLAFAGILPLLWVLFWSVWVTANAPAGLGYRSALAELDELDGKAETAEVRALREALEIDIAARYPQRIASPDMNGSLPPAWEALLPRILANHPKPSPEEARRARYGGLPPGLEDQ